MSKFDKVFEAREMPVKEKTSATGKNKNSTGIIKANPVAEIKEETESQTSQALKQRGRPKAKRSDPDFVGFTTYIRKDTHLKVKIALLQEADGRELSELVEELFIEWLKRR